MIKRVNRDAQFSPTQEKYYNQAYIALRLTQMLDVDLIKPLTEYDFFFFLEIEGITEQRP